MTGSEIRVRGWGFDAVECRQPCNDAASRALSRLILGRRLTCQILHYSHTRPVARCRQGETDIGAAMIEAGHAVEVCRFSRNAYGTCD
jgi:endonuclease YncB( thermonuclease family)